MLKEYFLFWYGYVRTSLPIFHMSVKYEAAASSQLGLLTAYQHLQSSWFVCLISIKTTPWFDGALCVKLFLGSEHLPGNNRRLQEVHGHCQEIVWHLAPDKTVNCQFTLQFCSEETIKDITFL